MAINYKEAGVDIHAGDRLVEWLRASNKNPHSEKIVSGIGGFAALFRAQFHQMKSPLLISCTDGVGTKVKVAAHFNDLSGVGQDLVAMCLNDLACTGGEPLFFLDYYATGQLDLNFAKQFLTGLRNACHESNCALIGGETAEMPGVYSKTDFDCAGFAVGVVDEPKLLGPHRVCAGDAIIGLASSGFHSNGYSLLRRVFEKDLDNWRSELLMPTALYGGAVGMLNQLGTKFHAASHVTGGGLDNLLRVIPDNCALELKPWPVPKIFIEVKNRTGESWDGLLRTLNCGVGFVVYVDAAVKGQAMEMAHKAGHKAFDMGTVVDSKKPEKFWTLDTTKLDS